MISHEIIYAFGHLLQRLPPSFFALPQHFFFSFLAITLSCFITSIFMVGYSLLNLNL
jgi:hypothetical protein